MSLKQTNNTNTLNDVLLSLHPHFDTGIADYKAIHKDENVSAKAIGGFLLYFVVFLVGIPLLVKNLENEELLISYLANVDLIATVLSFKNGPFGEDLFRYLYMDTRPLIGYINNNLINLYVLIVISYIITNTAVKNKSVTDAIAKASIIYTVTYLFPGRFISELMHATYNNMTHIFPNGDKNLFYYLTLIIGFGASIILILMEAFITKHFYKSLSHVYKRMGI